MADKLDVLQSQRTFASFRNRAPAERTSDAYVCSLAEDWATRAWLGVTSHPNYSGMSTAEKANYFDEHLDAPVSNYCASLELDASIFQELAAPALWTRIGELVNTPIAEGGRA